jgi:hypothetical protein
MQQPKQPIIPTQGMIFSPEEMDALRHGKLNETHKQQLRANVVRALLIPLGCIFPFVCLLTTLAVYTEQATRDISISAFVRIFAIIWIALIMSAVITFIARMALHWWNFNQDLRAGVAESMTGKTRIYTEPSGTNRQQYVEVGGLRFPITPWFYELKEPNSAYRVYYLPRSKVLITAERVGDVL